MSQPVVIKKEDVVFMLTRDVAETIDARIVHDSEFAIALLDEAVSLFLNGEPETARLVLRDLVNATIGFEGLAVLGSAIATAKPSKSLHRMLSAKGNPTMDHLTMIFMALRQELQVEIKVQVVACG
jgi:DNA-binding phage protein